MANPTAESAVATHEGDAHANGHPAHLQHHFVSSEQQFDAAKMGMWLFLITEILLFSGMFVAYVVYRVWHPEVFEAASTLLDPFWGGVNTVVLLTSSLTVALAIRYIQEDDQKWLFWNLIFTLILAGCFMVVKYIEYTGKFAHGVFPGAGYEPHGVSHGVDYADFDIPYAPQFFSIYFVMTGIHGFHVLIGMVIMAVLAFRTKRGAFSSAYYTPVELSGLYWHLVDIIWIFLFPLLYLI